jgi:hypothetical protein
MLCNLIKFRNLEGKTNPPNQYKYHKISGKNPSSQPIQFHQNLRTTLSSNNHTNQKNQTSTNILEIYYAHKFVANHLYNLLMSPVSVYRPAPSNIYIYIYICLCLCVCVHDSPYHQPAYIHAFLHCNLHICDCSHCSLRTYMICLPTTCVHMCFAFLQIAYKYKKPLYEHFRTIRSL